jgi:phospholipid/cholesterol/gamma-HCH transport system substrate-binding protein
VSPEGPGRSRARRARSLPSWAIGLFAIVVVAFGFYLAFTKELPFAGEGYQVKAVFANAQNLREKSPVRIAGVNVGEVTEVEGLPESNAAEVTMSISESGRPIHSDARMQLRPRLFLEGNLFVDVHPGSPSAPELGSADVIPVQQTSNSVQVDQLLTNVLQADVRGNLQLLLRTLGDAFQRHGGAEGFRELYRTGGPAYENTALVNEALLGTRAHDLSRLVRNLDIVARALGTHEPQLKGLVTNLRTVTGSFAAEDEALRAAIAELPAVLETARPVFDHLNASFPLVRAFAREALPGVRSASEAIDAATPFIAQLRALVSAEELRGLTADLRPTVPQLASLVRRQRPFMEQARALSSCFNNVTIPWGNSEIPDDFFEPTGPIFKETAYGLVGLNGESRSGDGNGQLFRVQQGGGSNTVQIGSSFGLTDLPIVGVDPPIESSAKTPFVLPGGRYVGDIPCENQDPPDLRSGGPGPPPTQFTSHARLEGPIVDLARRKSAIALGLLKAQTLSAAGETAAAARLRRHWLPLQREFERHGQPRLERLLGATSERGPRR